MGHKVETPFLALDLGSRGLVNLLYPVAFRMYFFIEEKTKKNTVKDLRLS